MKLKKSKSKFNLICWLGSRTTHTQSPLQKKKKHPLAFSLSLSLSYEEPTLRKIKKRVIQVEEERESERQNLRHLPQTRTHLYFSSLRLSSQHFPRSSRTIYGGCWCGCCWPLSISQQPQQKRQRQQEKQPRLALNI